MNRQSQIGISSRFHPACPDPPVCHIPFNSYLHGPLVATGISPSDPRRAGGPPPRPAIGKLTRCAVRKSRPGDRHAKFQQNCHIIYSQFSEEVKSPPSTRIQIRPATNFCPDCSGLRPRSRPPLDRGDGWRPPARHPASPDPSGHWHRDRCHRRRRRVA
jgi:hypothetical protein